MESADAININLSRYKEQNTMNTENKNISINNQEEPDYAVYGNCDTCTERLGCYRLVDSLVQDILSLEEEMIRWRQALIKYLPPLEARDLHADIFDNLAPRHYDDDAYQSYLKAYGYKEDPLESEEHTQMLWRLSRGTDETSVNL